MDGFLSSVLDLTVPFATPFIRMFMMGLPITLIVLLMRSKVSKKRLIKENLFADWYKMTILYSFCSLIM